MYNYEYPRPALTVDIVLFGIDHQDLEVLLIKRKNEPFKDCWAVPGGFLEMEETVKEGALRELKEETGLTVSNLLELHSFSAIDRDPRERIVTIAHCALIKKANYNPKGSDDAKDACWFSLKNLPILAADHKEIIALAHRRLKELGWLTNILGVILPKRFQLNALTEVFNCFYNQSFESEKLVQRLKINENLISNDDGTFSFLSGEGA